ncbi:uncharacterized protein LOC124815500 isoform X1 [Hydra vulgaris]|uniref:uncharacterized protein LOC124815500 isoform X1 n=1 Tax=Hydra vulgaris TaxID=6087 RepID=UPI001F5E5B6C|nr:uncharacterized protein LOC124815500 isoform X2 [Hydra vulgaris]
MEIDIRKVICQYFLSYSAMHKITALIMEKVHWLMIFLIFIPNFTLIAALYASSKGTLLYQEKLVMLLSAVDLTVAVVQTPLKILITTYLDNMKCFQVAIAAFWHLFPTMFSCCVVVVISVERYLTIVHNNKWHGIQIKNIHLTFVVFLFFTISIALSLWFAISIATSSYENFPYIYSSIGSVTFFYLIFVTFTNISLLTGTKEIMRSCDINIQRNKMLEKQLNKTIAMISVTLVVLYLPTVVAMLILVAALKTGNDLIENISIILMSWSLLLCQANSMINSVIYILRCRKIKNYFLYKISNVFIRKKKVSA